MSRVAPIAPNLATWKQSDAVKETGSRDGYLIIASSAERRKSCLEDASDVTGRWLGR
jgi:hypothetical protein